MQKRYFGIKRRYWISLRDSNVEDIYKYEFGENLAL